MQLSAVRTDSTVKSWKVDCNL